MIDFIFQIINFVILLLLGIYLFKKYGYKNLKKKFQEQQNQIENLDRAKKDLEESEVQIHQKIFQQEIECQNLRLKVDTWRANSLKIFNENQEKRQHLIEQIEKSLEFKKKQFNLSNLKKQVTPVIIKNLETELKEYFTKEENSKNYLDILIKQMGKNNI